jgi:hypothetical protein
MEQNHSHTSPEAATDEPAFPSTAQPSAPEEEADASSPAYRHDGFTPKRRRKFLEVLSKTGCVRDACRKTGMSDTAAYKLRNRDPEFAALWATALSKVGSDLELLAWQRAVDGIEEEVFAYGKPIGTRRKRDSNLFRMILLASNPAKYGGQGFGSRKALEKKIRKEILAEQQAQNAAPDMDEVRERLVRRIERLREREIREGRIHVDEQGRVVPAGYRLVPIDDPASGGEDAPEREPGQASTSEEASRPAASPYRPEPEPFGPGSGGAAGGGFAPPFERKVRAEPRIRCLGGY